MTDYALAKAAFLRICDLPQHERQAALKQIAETDAELHDLLLTFLEADQVDGGFADSLARLVQSEVSEQLNGSPEWVGQYQIIRRIGQGGMGTVFEARQENPKRQVALKVLRLRFCVAEPAATFRVRDASARSVTASRNRADLRSGK